jgi:glucosamine--fructose-6-phosphate aminotransferase (isomerizing)
VRFRYDEQIESQPAAVEAVLRRTRARLDASRPLVFCGQGTSLHAARVAAAWAGYPARAFESHELALRVPVPDGAQVVAISHSGGGFTAAVLRKARAAGARTFAVCGEAARADADVLVPTCAPERAQTHSVSYLTALAAVGQMLGLDLAEAPAALRETLSRPAPLEEARRLAGKDPLLVAGFGLDAIAAAETALKLKEATWKWAEGLAVEQALHGPQAALREGMAAVLYPSAEDGGRTGRLRELCAGLGVEVVELAVPPCSDALRPLLSAVPGQRLAAEIARLVGGDPDRSRHPVEQTPPAS